MSLAGLLLVAGCAGYRPPGPPMPAAMMPVAAEAVTEWVAATDLEAPIRLRLDWRLQDGRAGGGGTGTIRMVPPDSMRFDFRAPLGSWWAAGVVIGDEPLWAEPAEEVAKLVPNYPLLWGMVGRVRPPAPGDEVALFRDERLAAWRYTASGDTVEYLMELGGERRLVVDVRQQGRRLGRVLTHLGEDGLPLKSRLDIPSVPARLDVTYTQRTPMTSIPDSIWNAPE